MRDLAKTPIMDKYLNQVFLFTLQSF